MLPTPPMEIKFRSANITSPPMTIISYILVIIIMLIATQPRSHAATLEAGGSATGEIKTQNTRGQNYLADKLAIITLKGDYSSFTGEFCLHLIETSSGKGDKMACSTLSGASTASTDLIYPSSYAIPHVELSYHYTGNGPISVNITITSRLKIQYSSDDFTIDAPDKCNLQYEPTVSIGDTTINEPFKDTTIISGGNGSGSVSLRTSSFDGTGPYLATGENKRMYYDIVSGGDVSWDATAGSWSGPSSQDYIIKTRGIPPAPGLYSGSITATLSCE